MRVIPAMLFYVAMFARDLEAKMIDMDRLLMLTNRAVPDLSKKCRNQARLRVLSLFMSLLD